MSCLKCSEVFDCGTVNKMLISFNKPTLLLELNKTTTETECPDFNLCSNSGEVLKRRLERLIEISKERKSKLKIARNKSKANMV